MTEGERHSSTAWYFIQLKAIEWAGEEEILSQRSALLKRYGRHAWIVVVQPTI